MKRMLKSSWLINDRKIATRITLIFLLLSGWWVLITFWLLPLSTTDPVTYARVDLFKDGGYILIAIVLLYWLIRSNLAAFRRSERALRQSEERYRTLMENLPIGVYRTTPGPTGQFLMINRAGFHIFGYDSEEALKAIHVSDVYVDPVERAQFSERLLAQGHATGVQLQLKRKDGTPLWASITATVIYDEQGRAAYFDCTLEDITARKQTEALLARERDMLHALLDNIPDTIYFKDTASRFTLINQAQVRVLGVDDPSQAVGRTDADFFLAEVARGAFEEEQVIVATGQPLIDREEYNPTRDGRPRWFSATKTPIRDKDGQVIGLVGVSRNITARKQTEGKLRVSEAELRALFNAMPDVILVLDRQGRYLQIAPTNPALLYRPSTELLGKTLHEVFAVEQADLFLEAVRRAADTRQTVNLEYCLKIGNREVWFATTLSPLLEDSVLWVARDITDRKLAEAALRESEERYRQLVDLSPDGIVVHRAGQVVFINQAAVKLLRAATAGDILGHPVINFVHPDDRVVVSERFRQMLDMGRSVPPLEERFLRVDGTTVEVEVVAAPLIYHSQPAIQVVARDITLRKQRERELTAIGRVASALRAARTRAEMLPIVLDQLQSLLKVEASALLLADPVRHESVIELARGQWTALEHQKIAWVTGDEVAGLVQRGSIYISHDPRSDLGLSQPDLFGDIQAVAVVPLMAEDQPLGALWVGPAAPGDEESRLLMAVADIAANAIHRADLHEQAQRRADQLAVVNTLGRALAETLDLSQVYEQVQVAIQQLLPDITSILISQFDTDQQLISCVYGVTDGERIDVGLLPAISLDLSGEGPQSECILTRYPVIVDDLPLRMQRGKVYAVIGGSTWPRSALYAPLLSRDKVIGAVQVQSYTLNRFSPGDAELLTLVANTAAVSIENAQLFEAERRQLRLAQTLQAVGGLLTAETSLDQVYNYLFDLLAQVVDYDSVSIQLIDDHHAYLAAGRGSSNVEQLRHTIESIIPPTLEERWGQLHQRLMVISDTQTDSRWIPAAGSEYIRSWIGAALRVKGRLLGLLNVDSATVNAYDESVGETVAAFANQAAIAIENAQLHEAVRRHAAELEQRVIERTAELERERQRLQAILDAAGEGIVFTDPEGIIEYVNPALEKLTGYAAGEVRGQNLRLWRSSRSAHAIIDEAWRAIRRGELWLGEMVNRRKDGALYEVAITIAPLNGAAGDLIGHVGILHDITHQKEVERLKDQFVTNVSHELRTPLANVKLYLHLLERGRPEKRGEYMQTLHREAARLTNLIEDMLDISRLDLGAAPLQSMPTDLNPLIDQLIIDRSALAADRSLSLERQLDPDLPPALADPPLLTQVMSNLMTNAINYTPPGGVITISTGVREQQQRRWITFSVRDTGPGIAPQDLPHLFERFYRGEVGRKSGAPGTGLGLAICQEIMARMDGQITVESRPATEGRGATFTVWLRPVDEELP